MAAIFWNLHSLSETCLLIEQVTTKYAVPYLKQNKMSGVLNTKILSSSEVYN